MKTLTSQICCLKRPRSNTGSSNDKTQRKLHFIPRLTLCNILPLALDCKKIIKICISRPQGQNNDSIRKHEKEETARRINDAINNLNAAATHVFSSNTFGVVVQYNKKSTKPNQSIKKLYFRHIHGP